MKKNQVFIMLIILGLVLVTQFQNCAAPRQANGTTPVTTPSGISSPDEIYKGQLSFTGSYRVFSQATHEKFEGACDTSQNGALIAWTLEHEKTVAAHGRIQCELGKFTIELDKTQLDPSLFQCGSEVTLKAQLGVNAHDIVFISNSCSAQN